MKYFVAIIIVWVSIGILLSGRGLVDQQDVKEAAKALQDRTLEPALVGDSYACPVCGTFKGTYDDIMKRHMINDRVCMTKVQEYADR